MKTGFKPPFIFSKNRRSLKTIFIFLFLLLFAAGCSNNQGRYTISNIEAKIAAKIASLKTAKENNPVNTLKNLKATVEASSLIYAELIKKQDSLAIFNSLNRMALIYIPAGEFSMGSSEYDSNHYEDEVPQHTVFIDSFWISKTQITNAMFAECVKADACKYSVSHTKNPHYLDPEYADHPVVYIPWDMAQTYCSWTGGRLPTEAEWEKAARGLKGAKYPWGLQEPLYSIEGQLFTNANNVIGDTTPAGLFLEGESYYGVLDMGGNVREWVLDWYDPDYYQYSSYDNPTGPDSGEKKVLKGASYLDPYIYARVSNRLAHDPKSSGAIRGFRCVYKEATTDKVKHTPSD